MLERRQVGRRDRSYPTPREVAADKCGCILGIWGRARYCSDSHRTDRAGSRRCRDEQAAQNPRSRNLATAAQAIARRAYTATASFLALEKYAALHDSPAKDFSSRPESDSSPRSTPPDTH